MLDTLKKIEKKNPDIKFIKSVCDQEGRLALSEVNGIVEIGDNHYGSSWMILKKENDIVFVYYKAGYLIDRLDVAKEIPPAATLIGLKV